MIDPQYEFCLTIKTPTTKRVLKSSSNLHQKKKKGSSNQSFFSSSTRYSTSVAESTRFLQSHSQATMSDVGLKVLDGAQLRSADLSYADCASVVAGSRVLELAESRASQLLDGLSLPQDLKSSTIKRLDLDVGAMLQQDEASVLFRDYITAIADELRDDPLVVAILDGKVIKMLLEDEDDFAMLAENLFTDLDTEDEGKLSKSQIRGALELMKVEMGVPPFSEYPVLNDIIKKHGAEGEQKLGQAQFAELLQPVLHDIADALAENCVILVQNIKIINGSKLKKLLADDSKLNELVQKILDSNQTKQEDTKSIDAIRFYVEKNGKEIGLLSSDANEAVSLLFDSVFSSIDKQKKSATLANKDGFLEILKDILVKFVEQLEVNPVFYDV